jgi:leucine dehydrogenase
LCSDAYSIAAHAGMGAPATTDSRMGVHILDAMAREGFEQVIALHDRRSRLRAFVGIHDSSAGPAFGGIRRWSYLDEDQALRDCLRLSLAMSHKCALAELPAGGAKIVVLDRTDLDVDGAYRAIGRCIESLDGRVYTGPDVGTGARELACVADETRFVTDPGPGGPGQLAEATAEGVFRGMGAALRHLDGEEDWSARTVVVQGLGEVGSLVAARLVARGARVLASEIDNERARAIARSLPIQLLEPSSEYDARCDVFAPCALGGILHDLTLTRLVCRVVAGAANNVLAKALHGDRLHELGILFAPDVVISAGALIRGAHFHLDGRKEPLETIGDQIAGTLTRLFERARAEHQPPARLAVREADERIARLRGQRT